MVNGRVLALTAGGLGRINATTQAATSLLPCPVPSHPGDGRGQGLAAGLEEGAKRCRETPSSPGTHALPLRRMRWCPLCPQLFRIGPGAHGCTVLRHGEKPEVVSTSPSGQEAGLSTSQRTPAGICSSPPLGSGYSLIPREELNATHNSCCITHSSPNSWAADKI